MGVFRRGNKLWVRYQDLDGTWCNASTGYSVGQEKLAEATYDEIAARVRSASAAGEAVVGPLTVRRYVADWIEERRKLDLDWKNDRARLQHHVLPVIGDMKIADIRTRHIIDLFHRIRSNKERPVAQRTVYSIYSTVSALFRDAKLADKIEQTPCCLDERQLGPLVDKDPEWRATAIFTRDEVETLISHPEIPLDRRIVYALELLAGVRTGEAAALRWRHYDPTKQPLGELLVAFSYSTLRSCEKTTKTDSSKHIPVHPTLAAMLAEWKLGGWAAMMGRLPEPDDLIVPMPPEHAARRRTRSGEAFRGHDYSGERWRRDDLPALGWRHRRHYDMRATFITLALEDGPISTSSRPA
jgi:integrase